MKMEGPPIRFAFFFAGQFVFVAQHKPSTLRFQQKTVRIRRAVAREGEMVERCDAELASEGRAVKVVDTEMRSAYTIHGHS